MLEYGIHYYLKRNLLFLVSLKKKSVNISDYNYLFNILAFTCHDQGASSLIYAPQHQVLISSGKKGDVCIFDVRQRTLRHRFQVRIKILNIRNFFISIKIEYFLFLNFKL